MHEPGADVTFLLVKPTERASHTYVRQTPVFPEMCFLLRVPSCFPLKAQRRMSSTARLTFPLHVLVNQPGGVPKERKLFPNP